MVAAGALVTPGTEIPSGTLYGGSPAKYMRHLSASEVIHLQQSAQNYLNYTESYKD